MTSTFLLSVFIIVNDWLSPVINHYDCRQSPLIPLINNHWVIHRRLSEGIEEISSASLLTVHVTQAGAPSNSHKHINWSVHLTCSVHWIRLDDLQITIHEAVLLCLQRRNCLKNEGHFGDTVYRSNCRPTIKIGATVSIVCPKTRTHSY